MKEITLTAVCTADVEEEWTFEVPDDFDLTGEVEEVFDRVMAEVMAAKRPDVHLKGVENTEVDNERDRDWTAMKVGEVEAP